MDQFWFPNGKERQNCTVSAPPDILRPVQFSVSVPNRMPPSSDLEHDFGKDGSQRRESAGSAPPALPIFKDHKTAPPETGLVLDRFWFSAWRIVVLLRV